MKVVYIAGPFRAKTPFGVKLNVDAAEKEMHDLVVFAHMHGFKISVLCPHAMTRNLDGTADDPYWLDATLELMRRCDAVLMLPSWEVSAGARGERAEALRLGMPVFYARHELLDWSTTTRHSLCVDKAGALMLAPANRISPDRLSEQIHLIRSIKRIGEEAGAEDLDKGTVYHRGKPVVPGRYRIGWSDGLTSGATVYMRLDGTLMLSGPDLEAAPRRLSSVVNGIRSLERLDEGA